MGVAQYTGHGANTGGLQQHSIGNMYPFTIEAYGNLRPVRWRWRNLVTGQVGNGQPTHNLAMIDLTSLRINTLMNS